MNKEHIEQERVRFHSVESEYCTAMENGKYVDFHVQIKFEGWLAAKQDVANQSSAQKQGE